MIFGRGKSARWVRFHGRGSQRKKLTPPQKKNIVVMIVASDIQL